MPDGLASSVLLGGGLISLAAAAGQGGAVRQCWKSGGGTAMLSVALGADYDLG
jgi:hypothetical protein